MEDWPGGEKTGARVKWTVVGREHSLGALLLGELPRISSGSSRPCLDTLHKVVSGQTSPSAPAVHPAQWWPVVLKHFPGVRSYAVGFTNRFLTRASEQLTAAHNHGAGVCINASVLSVSWWACLCPIPGVLWRLHMIGHTVAAHKCPGLAGVGWRGSKGERRGLESDGLPGSQVCSN